MLGIFFFYVYGLNASTEAGWKMPQQDGSWESQKILTRVSFSAWGALALEKSIGQKNFNRVHDLPQHSCPRLGRRKSLPKLCAAGTGRL